MTKFACGRSARLRFRRAAAMLVVCFGPAVHAISQTAPAQPLTSERSTVNLDVYYRYPIAVGAEYQGLTSFDPFVSGFAVRDVAAEVRVPIPVMPTIQPFLRAGSLSFVQSGTVGTSKWDHTDYYGAIGTSWTHRFAKNFEIGLDLSGGIGQSMFPNLSAGGPVGSLDLLASAGARIVLVPLYNVAVDIRPSLRYQRTIGPLTEFDGFSFGVGFSVGYRFGEDPDAPASVIRSLRFSSAKLPGVFAAMQSYYSTNPIGYVTMTNTESFSITDLEVSFFQPGYMDAPTPVTSIPELAKGAETKIGILAAYGQEVFRTEGITPLAGELIVKYRSHGRPAEQRLAVSYDLYDRT
ncbi:MAG TPA: hypothetical protein VMV68_04305, partial [Spirochaetia bacterium]|nr:hypothetical protein [Spirochaetia bacterium]